MRRGLAFSWVLLAAACTIDPTQLAVFVSSDFAEGDLGAVAIGVLGPDGAEHDAGPFPLGESDPWTLPLSFGVAPRGGDPNRRVEIRASGLDPGRAHPLVTTRAITSFVEHRITRLDLFLARRCLYEAQDCAPEETCSALGCVPAEVEASSLSSIDEAPPVVAPAVEWTLWADSASGASVEVDDEGAALVGVTTGAGAYELQGVPHELPAGTGAFVLRVEPDGAVDWTVALRTNGAPSRPSILAMVTDGWTLWTLVAAPGGLLVESDGEVLLDRDDTRPYVLKLNDAGGLDGWVAFDEGTSLDMRAASLGPATELVLGGVTTGPGGVGGVTWAEGEGLVLFMGHDLTVSACRMEDTSVVGVATAAGAVAALAEGPSGPTLTRLDATCAPRAVGDLTDALFPLALAPAVDPALGVLTVSDVRLLAGDTGQVLAQVPFDAGGTSGLTLRPAGHGRFTLQGAFDDPLEFDGLSTGGSTSGGIVMGIGPALQGRWLRVLSSEVTTTVVDAATEGTTGAVVMAATGSGRFVFGDLELADRGGASVLVHRFLP